MLPTAAARPRQMHMLYTWASDDWLARGHGGLARAQHASYRIVASYCAGRGRRQHASDSEAGLRACELGAFWEAVAIPMRECGCDVPCPESPVVKITSDVWEVRV